MSQQKLIFALALIAGCVALASSQSMDLQQCSQTGQKLVSDYTQTIQQAMSKFTSSMAQQGQSTFDATKITDQLNEMAKEMQGMINTNGFNFEQIMNSYMRMVRLQMQLVTSTFNPSAGLSMGRSYMELLNTLMTTNSNFAMNMATACVPQLRDSSNRAY